MGSGATSRFGIEYPESTDTVNVNGDIQTAVTDIDTLLFSLSIVAKSASYAATIGQLVQMTGAHTVTSPAAGSNAMWGAMNASSGAAVTVVPASGVLNLPGDYGTASLSLPKQGDFAIFVCDGTNHNLIAGSADIMGLSVTAAAIEATFTAAGQLYVGTGSGTGELLAKGTAGQVLQVGGSDPSGLEWGAGAAVVARVHMATTTGGISAGTAIPFDTVDYDSASGWSASTHKYTVPNTGYYKVACTLAANSSGPGVMIMHNSSDVSLGPAITGTYSGGYTGYPGSVTDTVNCTAGDTLWVTWSFSSYEVEGGSAPNISWLTIEQVH